MKTLISIRMLVTVGLCLLSASCGKKQPSGASTTPKGPDTYPLPEKPLVANCEPGKPGGRLVIAEPGDPKTFNPITASDLSSRDVYRLLFSSLITFNWPKQEVEPGLLESWSVADDKKTWTLKLRKGVRWSDGQPLTAEDVVFTWNDVVYNTNINNVTVDVFRSDGKNFNVRKVDDFTVEVVTPQVHAPFLQSLDDLGVLPKHILAKAVAEKRFESTYGVNTPPDQLVCSGPYKLKTFKPGQLCLLERNPYYWAVDSKGQRLPYIDQVVFTVVPDMNAMSLRFLRGENDVFEHVRPDEFERYKQESASGKFKLLELGYGLERAFIWFNQNTGTNAQNRKPYVDPVKLKWFRNTKFRQAISYAIDRQSIINSVYAGRAKPNYGFESPANEKWYNPSTKKYPHDLKQAKALLAEIGIQDRNGDGVLEDSDGHPIEFVMNTNTGNNSREKTAVLIKEDLKRLGLNVIYQPIEFNTLVDKIDNTMDYDCVLLGLGGGSTDPASSMNVLKSDGFTHFWFPRQKKPSSDWEARIDELMIAQLKTLDSVERKKLFDEVQAIMAEQVPLIYTVSPEIFTAIRADIGNLKPTPLSYYRAIWNLEELFFIK